MVRETTKAVAEAERDAESVASAAECDEEAGDADAQQPPPGKRKADAVGTLEEQRQVGSGAAWAGQLGMR